MKGQPPLRSTRRIYEDNIKEDRKEVMWGHADWIHCIPYSNKCPQYYKGDG